ncbi:peptidyl-prolyl cis-trans isomerase sig-7-like [Stegodyphus dumicola]|uniref:peptidyl-prolyl cis-trans isomerase sig-7-like n=1 Tax=Stegodyphus dumicola TaxID=202533 RepID=UPI0015B253BB|nr:peptidyl-prolyl cis-trans isomerase sig-7-like [Stegodyphus dumicola]XP_035218385.1 peptidyl-prolyl cis-trans isomerase sig-7-like [Stegodyphus dumicola]
MSVVIETTIGDITVDLYLKERPNTCLNFLKLCKVKYYNLCVFHKVERNFIAQTGDPTATGRDGESIFCRLYGEQAKYFDAELKPRLKHEKIGTLSMVNNGNNMNGSQFFLTLGENLTYLDEVHTVFGEVAEGFETLLKINEAICDPNNRPYQDIRITHTVVLHDPYDDPKGLEIPDASPEPTREQLESNYIGADEEIDDTKGKSMEEIEEKIKESEAKARATILEMVGDIPDADVKPPENVLFVCKLNPVTTSEDLEIIFSRFGPIKSCEVIKDKKTGESLQYAFIEFENEEDCENAYFKMDNVLIDDRRIHVDFSQSVSKLQFDMQKKSSKGKPSQSQNFLIKNTQNSSRGYDMIFDMDENSNEPRTHRKVHRQKYSVSPKHKRKHKNESHDCKSSKADGNRTRRDECREIRKDPSSPHHYSSYDKYKRSHTSISEKTNINEYKRTNLDWRKPENKSRRKSRSPSPSNGSLRYSHDKHKRPQTEKHERNVAKWTDSDRRKQEKKSRKRSRSSSSSSESLRYSRDERKKSPMLVLGKDKRNVDKQSDSNRRKKEKTSSKKPRSSSSSNESSSRSRDRSQIKKSKKKRSKRSSSSSIHSDSSFHAHEYASEKQNADKALSHKLSSSSRTSYSKSKRYVSDSGSTSSSSDDSNRNSHSKSDREKVKYISNSKSASSPPHRVSLNSHSKSKAKALRHVSDSRSSISPECSTQNLHSNSKRKKTKYTSRSSAPDLSLENMTTKRSHHKSYRGREDSYHR